MTTSLLAQTANDVPRPVTTTATGQARQKAAVARAVREHRAVYYISRYTPTGSLLPQVACRYEGHTSLTSSFTPNKVYNAGDLNQAGALNVGEALNALDPAISIR